MIGPCTTPVKEMPAPDNERHRKARRILKKYSHSTNPSFFQYALGRRAAQGIHRCSMAHDGLYVKSETSAQVTGDNKTISCLSLSCFISCRCLFAGTRLRFIVERLNQSRLTNLNFDPTILCSSPRRSVIRYGLCFTVSKRRTIRRNGILCSLQVTDDSSARFGLARDSFARCRSYLCNR